MRIAIIGRTELLYDTAVLLKEKGHEIVCILTAKEAPEYIRSAKDFENLALSWGIPFSTGSRILDYTQFLRDSKAEIAISINYSGIIPQSIIDLFPMGILNAHGGDLPRYRGNACQAWAILNGESRIGLCIHKMIGDELDSGDIIAREYLEIDNHTKVTDVWKWLRERTSILMLYAVHKLAVDPLYILEKQSKNPIDSLRCYPRLPEDGKINWKASNIDIIRLINASNKPYSGAFCQYEGKTLRIWDASIIEDNEVFFAVPGQVVLVGVGFIDIACGSGKVRLKEIEYDQTTMTPDLIIRSIRKRLY